jgi:hypothetical protein
MKSSFVLFLTIYYDALTKLFLTLQQMLTPKKWVIVEMVSWAGGRLASLLYNKRTGVLRVRFL